MNDYEGIAQHLGGMIGNRGRKAPVTDMRKFLQTPQGGQAARTAIESIIGASQTQPLPIPTYQAILKTIQASMQQETP